ncbi:hypothetical protein [Mucilaginibacter lappiensis]|uniref:Glycosyltransferase RgtA/B/C/D-like domain-containing protein n=1 Tax=Mucilaginibacter lappiensis TaxID=354630 RepID=A0A841JB83_9SPHI|nr:hypothetical protein [Mucilaginibacter lappiensis]MBB6128030.1 hypothetical protein [Mucilaginibacter lappiensis]
MPAQKSHIHQIILAALGILVLILGTMIYLYPTSIFPDSCWGFQVLRAMQMGGGFNMAIKPDPADVAKNSAEFLTWWSPGQYLVPYVFKLILGINTGKAAAVTVTLFTLSGLGGFYLLFKKVGFTPLVAAVSVLVIACQQAFIVPYIFYNGGEVLLFGFAGWFLYGCAAIDKPGWKIVVFLLLSGWMGFCCKSSFLWIYGAGCIYLWITLSSGQTTIWGWIKKGFWIGTPAILSLAVIYKFYLSRGATPASGAGSIKLAWETFSFPMAAPILAGFSVDDIMNGLIYHDDTPILNHFWSVLIVVLLAILSILLVSRIVRKAPGKKYALLLIVFYSVAILFFGYNFLKQAYISYEARHLRLIGLLIIPGVVYLVSQSGIFYKAAFGFICMVIAFFSFRYFVPGYLQNKTVNARGTSGLAQMFIDQPSLNYIMDLDKKNNNAIFVFTSPDLGLEINHNRFITLEAIDSDIKIDYDSYAHYGHAGPIFILLPASYMGPKSNIIRKCFPGYTGFKMDMLSNDYVLYSAK